MVISGFGLSAFLFSSISHIAFSGNTSSFLRLLAFGTALPMVLGYFLVRPIPLPPVDERDREHGHGHAVTNVGGAEDDEEQRLLDAEGEGEEDRDSDQIDDPDTL
jgi:hypothetical protein